MKKNFHFCHSAIIYTPTATILQFFLFFLQSATFATTHTHTRTHIREAPRLKNAIFTPKQAHLSHFKYEADKSHHRHATSPKQNVLGTGAARPGATRSKRNNNITNARTRYSNFHRQSNTQHKLFYHFPKKRLLEHCIDLSPYMNFSEPAPKCELWNTREHFCFSTNLLCNNLVISLLPNVTKMFRPTFLM